MGNSHNFKDLTGHVYGRLTVLQKSEEQETRVKWDCECICGNVVKVGTSQLKSGHTQSCGCLQKERTGAKATTHGKTKTRLYSIWCAMKQRCYDVHASNYCDYGNRGIAICEDWKNNFLAFEEWSLENGYDKKLSIDRINVNGNYEPNNCRWATRKEQANNKTNNKHIEYNGEIKTISDWCDFLDLDKTTVYSRLRKGYSVEQAFEKNKHNVILVELNGETHNLKEWCFKLNLNYKTITKRIRSGWTCKRALTTPIRKVNKNE